MLLFVQHLTALLAAPDHQVVTATLQAFVALVRKTHIASIRYPGGPEQNSRLLALAQGWGGKEQVNFADRMVICLTSMIAASDSHIGYSLLLACGQQHGCCRGWDWWNVLMMMILACERLVPAGVQFRCRSSWCLSLMVSSVLTGASLGNPTPS